MPAASSRVDELARRSSAPTTARDRRRAAPARCSHAQRVRREPRIVGRQLRLAAARPRRTASTRARSESRGRPRRRRRSRTGRTARSTRDARPVRARRRSAVRRVVRRRAHPLGQRVEQRDVDGRARPVDARASSAVRMPEYAYMPAAMSATEMPTLARRVLGAGEREQARPRSARAGRTPFVARTGPTCRSRRRADDEARIARAQRRPARSRAARPRPARGSARRHPRARAAASRIVRRRPAASGRASATPSIDSARRSSSTGP